jgi:hypothetical protein
MNREDIPNAHVPGAPRTGLFGKPCLHRARLPRFAQQVRFVIGGSAGGRWQLQQGRKGASLPERVMESLRLVRGPRNGGSAAARRAAGLPDPTVPAGLPIFLGVTCTDGLNGPRGRTVAGALPRNPGASLPGHETDPRRRRTAAADLRERSCALQHSSFLLWTAARLSARPTLRSRTTGTALGKTRGFPKGAGCGPKRSGHRLPLSSYADVAVVWMERRVRNAIV